MASLKKVCKAKRAIRDERIKKNRAKKTRRKLRLAEKAGLIKFG